ncbi:hypothetical protein [Tenacibaculum maritimum]|uniref:hypothetical protein n=1 Tax=Tenacibaculum maritimum TaxID=107401 RepID=UPI0038769892
MEKKAIRESLVKTTALTVGAATSRVVAENAPIKNMHLKRGILVLTGALGAAFLDRSTSGKAFVQDMASGMAATQAAYWIKDAMAEKLEEKSLLKTALGNPLGTYDNPVQFRLGYVNAFPPEQTQETSHEDVKYTM